MGNQDNSELKQIVKMAKSANDQRHEAHSRETLKRHVTTKFKTTMIGDLARFEKFFGGVWGHGLDEADLTEDQLEARNKWNLVRTEVLNNGNNQLRAALAEIDNYTVRYNKHQYQFNIKKDSQELTTDE